MKGKAWLGRIRYFQSAFFFGLSAPTKPRLLAINFEIYWTIKAVLQILTGSGFNMVSGSGFRQAKMSHKKGEKWKNLFFWRTICPSWMPKNKYIAIWYRKFNFSHKFLHFIVKILDLVPRSGFTKKPSSASGFTKTKSLDPDPDSKNTDLKNCFKEILSIRSQVSIIDLSACKNCAVWPQEISYWKISVTMPANIPILKKWNREFFSVFSAEKHIQKQAELCKIWQILMHLSKVNLDNNNNWIFKVSLTLFPNKYHRQEKKLVERTARSPLPSVLGLEEEQEQRHGSCATQLSPQNCPISLSLSLCPRITVLSGRRRGGKAHLQNLPR